MSKGGNKDCKLGQWGYCIIVSAILSDDKH